MKFKDEPVYDLLRKSTAVNAVPKLIAEFNHNRYTKVVAENDPLESIEGYNLDAFPISSIVEPNRPPAGNLKATLDGAKISPEVTSIMPAIRFTLSEDVDSYKYWRSPYPTVGTTMPSSESGSYITSCAPYITYETGVIANKIVIGFENSYASPVNYDVYIKTSSTGSWTLIGNSIDDEWVLDQDGRLIIYYNGTSWSQDIDIDNHMEVFAVQVRLYTLDKSDAYLYLIEMSARLEKDFTEYLESTTHNSDIGDTDSLRPIGRLSANTGSVTLFNPPVDEDDISKGLLFNQFNPNSIYYGLTDSNVKFTLSYIFDDSDYGGTGAQEVPAFVMYADDNWNAAGAESVNIKLKDYAKFLQETKVPSLYFANETAPACAWKTLNAIGFSSIEIEESDVIGATIFPHFWTNSESTAWEVLQDISESTQMVFYFAPNGNLKMRTREAAYQYTSDSVWTLRGKTVGDEVADLTSSITPETSNKANAITLEYKTIDIEKNNYGDYLRSTVWEPSELTVLRSSDLLKDLKVGDEYVYIGALQAETWPYEGYMLIGGEKMQYKGKVYAYYPLDDPDTLKSVLITNQEEYLNAINDIHPTKRSVSQYTGAIKLIKRGLFESAEMLHKIDTMDEWEIARVSGGNGASAPTGNGVKLHRGLRQEDVWSEKKKKYVKQWVVKNRELIGEINVGSGLDGKILSDKTNPDVGGYARITTNENYQIDDDWLLMKRRIEHINNTINYGTSFRFEPGATSQRCGIHIFGGHDVRKDSGYYIEFKPSSKASKKDLEHRVILRHFANNKATNSVIGKKEGIGAVIVEGTWYKVDVKVTRKYSINKNGDVIPVSDTITVFLDGILLQTFTVNKNLPPDYGLSGLFVRGHSDVMFEYYYAIDGEAFNTSPDQSFLFFDLYSGGYASNVFIKEYLLSMSTSKIQKNASSTQGSVKRSIGLFDEFGPIVHEMREFDVKYDSELPVLSTDLINTNQAGISIINWYPNSFGAKFIAVNTSRIDEAFSGELREIDYKAAIMGYRLRLSEAKKIEIFDQDSINTHGKVSLQLSGTYIQDESSAQKLGEWIKEHWERANTIMEVTIFGNPLIDIGDVVTVDYPLASLNEAKKYFVLASDTSWSTGGLETRLKLRQAE